MNPLLVKYFIMLVALTGICDLHANCAGAKSYTYTDSLSSSVSSYLKEPSSLLYPQSTKRFYELNENQPVWFKKGSLSKPVWDALLFLDCAIQFGLDHHDYHPAELNYDRLKDITTNKNIFEVARADVLLTDAMIAFINHLHYGKLNPVFTPQLTDMEDFKGIKADSVLNSALKGSNFYKEIVNIQPASREYKDLQEFLRLAVGQYTGDSYQMDVEKVRLMSVNLERRRWETTSGQDRYVLINIPAFLLRYHRRGDFKEFRVITGKASTPTPTLSSAIWSMTTSPAWRLTDKMIMKELLPLALKFPGYPENNNLSVYDRDGNTVVSDPVILNQIKNNIAEYIARQSPGCDNALGIIAFNFPNDYNLYLTASAGENLFDKENRALSSGCISLQYAEEFARLLLTDDGAGKRALNDLNKALKKDKKKIFTLKTPVPVSIGYFTCEIKNGLLISYQDVYAKDPAIADKLFGSDQLLSSEIKEFIKKKNTGINEAFLMGK